MQAEDNTDKPIDDQLEREKQELLRLLLEESESNDEVELDVIKVQNYAESLPLSFTQERLWFMQQLEPDSPLYNFHVTLRLKGNVNEQAVEYALNRLIERHSIFRSSIEMEKGTPSIKIVDFEPVEMECIELSGLTSEQQLNQLTQLSEQETASVFDLNKDLLLKYKLIKFTDDRYSLLLTIHHMAIDGWSMGILFDEISSYYEQYYNKELKTPSRLAIQYVDFSNWQRETVTGDKLENLLDYWRKKLAEPLPVLELATDHIRLDVQSNVGGNVTFEIDKQLSGQVLLLAQKYETTSFVVLLAVFRLLLSRYSSQNDICIGTPFGDRNRVDIEKLIGPFINNVVLRFDTSSCRTVDSLIEQERDNFQQALLHRELPFEKLVEALNPVRDRSRSPLFQVMFIYINTPPVVLKLDDIVVDQLTRHSATSEYDVSLTIFPANKTNGGSEGLSGFFEYSKDLFDDQTIVRMVGHFKTLLKGVCEQDEAPRSSLEMLSKGELQTIFNDFQGKKIRKEPYKGIHLWVEEQAQKTPNKIAVEYQGGAISYQKLNEEANQLARYLIFDKHVETETIVGLCVSRGREMMVSMLAILKAGAAYLALDPKYPESRILYMLQNSGSSLVITEELFSHFFDNVDISCVILDTQWRKITHENLRHIPLPECQSNQLAYVIYTSGSTGKPKGVLVEHGNVINFLQSMSTELGINIDDRLLAVTTISFDIHVLELFLPLVNGATVVLADNETVANAQKLYDTLVNSNITIMQATPSTWQMILQTEKWTSTLPLSMLSGGEPLSLDLAKQLLLCGQTLWNLYGPTETTVWSSIQQVLTNAKNITVGKAIANTEMYIVNSTLQLQPIGVPGELLIGGKGVTRGYLAQKQLTDERFIPNPFSKLKQDRVYKTGDIARLTTHGNIEILGRLDNQIKLRGHRIELGEIESALVSEDRVKDAVVIIREDNPGDRRLVAYVIKSDAIDFKVLKQAIAGKIPEYMLPSTFVELEMFPKTANKKIDRNRFPKPIIETNVLPDNREQLSEVEILLIDICNEVLSINSAGIYDNFFDLGGHSLLTMKVIAKFEKKTGVRLQPGEFFQQTIGQIAAFHKPEIAKDEENKKYNEHIPMFFGPEDEQLFAIYHSAILENTTKSQSVVICNPIGHEYYRTHRGLRQLANKLSKRGVNVLRFDYSASGDSYGESNLFSLVQARKDLEMAIEQCKTMSGHSEVTLLGVRLGASLAFEVSQTRNDIKNLVLWAPIVKGDQLVSEWVEEQHEFERSMEYEKTSERPTEIMGLPFTTGLSSEISEVDLSLVENLVNSVLLIKTVKKEPNMVRFEQNMRKSASKLSVENIQGNAFWRIDSIEAIVPVLILQKIIDWL